jgi:hypothetical protein
MNRVDEPAPLQPAGVTVLVSIWARIGELSARLKYQFR